MAIGVGVVGAGSVNIATSAHLPAIQMVRELELKALCDVNEAGVKALAQRYGVDAYTDYGAMLKREDIQMIQVCTPDYLHAEHTIKAAEAGKHVLCQKPMALSVRECAAMRAAVTRAGVQFMCVQSNRYSDPYRTIKHHIDDGRIGAVRWVKYSFKGRFFPYPKESYHRKAMSKGQLLHNGPHWVDLVSCFVGDTPVEVCAISLAHYPTDDRLETDNYYLSHMRFPSGAMATVEMNLLMLDPPGFPARTSVEVVGTHGRITLGTDRPPALEVFAGRRIERPAAAASQGTPEAFAELMRDFVRAIVEKGPPPIPMDWSIAVTRTCLAALRSIEVGGPIQLTEAGDGAL